MAINALLTLVMLLNLISLLDVNKDDSCNKPHLKIEWQTYRVNQDCPVVHMLGNPVDANPNIWPRETPFRPKICVCEGTYKNSLLTRYKYGPYECAELSQASKRKDAEHFLGCMEFHSWKWGEPSTTFYDVSLATRYQFMPHDPSSLAHSLHFEPRVQKKYGPLLSAFITNPNCNYNFVAAVAKQAREDERKRLENEAIEQEKLKILEKKAQQKAWLAQERKRLYCKQENAYTRFFKQRHKKNYR